MTEVKSKIVQFYQNQTIFLTGGTGFLGKLLIEKLLRVCWDVKRIYVLLRPKHGKSPQQRFDEIFEHLCFDLIRHKNLKEKVFPISGDCNEPSLGLNLQDKKILMAETTCIFHVAANVSLDQPLKKATQFVRATKDLLDLAKKMRNLKVLIHVSTAYSNCIHHYIKEEFYEPPMKAETLLNLTNELDDNVLEKITPGLLGSWPNTYVYVKCIIEDLIKKANLHVPTVVVRPSCIGNTIKEPKAGWIDNYYGFVGVGLGLQTGLVRSLKGKKENNCDVIPADHACNVILAAAWKNACEESNTPKIYNCVGQRLSLGLVVKLLQEFYWEFPSVKYIWYKSFEVRSNNLLHEMCIFLPGLMTYFIDCLFLFVGKSTNMAKIYHRLNKMMAALTYFTTHEFKFDETNLINLKNEMSDEDQKIFRFMEKIDWYEYFRTCCLGIRLYLLKDPIDTLPKAKTKLKILFVLHYGFLALLCYCSYLFIRIVSRVVFKISCQLNFES